LPRPPSGTTEAGSHGWEITPARMAAAAAATGQIILGPPLTADQMIPGTYLTS
jgi:hypothetical protein